MCENNNSSNDNQQPTGPQESGSDSENAPFDPEMYLRPLTEGAQIPNQRDYTSNNDSESTTD